jgi:hypothetical protein
MSGVRVAAALTAVSVCLPAAHAAAQGSGGGKWDVEFHVAGVAVTGANGGTGIGEFPAGNPIATGGFTSTTRAVSSWYFGDGAQLLNQVNAGFGVTSRLTPLDGALRTQVGQQDQNVAFGFRVGRTLNPRIDAEFTFDYSPGGLTFTAEATDAIQAASSSFGPAWSALLATGGTSNRQANSVLELRDGDGYQMSALGALRLYFTDAGRVRPFATAGAGARFNGGDAPSATLTGTYSFLFAGVFPINERDVATVRVDVKDTSLVGMVGGGFDYRLSPRQGIRAGVRLHLGPNQVNTVVSASPSVTIQTPAFAINTGGNPSVQFSNTTLLGRSSSLSGPVVTDMQTFTASGIYLQTNFVVGYFLKF